VKRKTAIAVIAFNRPDLLKELLLELTKSHFKDLIISVDCDLHGNSHSEIVKMASHEFRKLEWRFRTVHLGIGKHVPFMIDEVLKDFDNVVVLEDDVRVSTNALESGLELLSDRLPDRYFTVGFFGGIEDNSFFRLIFGENSWRETEFFSAWGWAVQRETWNIYKQVITREDIEINLGGSSSWQMKCQDSKTSWTNRFERVANNPSFTWDFQMQYATYAQNKVHLLPIYRSADNVGFGESRATNTISPRPGWYRGSASSKRISARILSSGLKLKFLIYWDKITWSGDLNPPIFFRVISSLIRKIRS
jgi:hypothetical protein